MILKSQEYDESLVKERRIYEHELGRKLLEQGLWEEYGIIDTVEQQPHQKPYLKNHIEIDFSISHTKGLVICALSDRSIGADVEKIREFHQGLLRKVCTDREAAYILEKDSQERFFRIWTLKEAYLKATGQGITVPLGKLQFLVAETGQVTANITGWKFTQFRYGSDYIISICEKEIS